MSRALNILRQVWLPLVIWLCYVVLLLAQHLGVAPSTDSIVTSLLEHLASNRLLWVIISSFIENIIGASLYFPGSIIMLTGMAQTAGSPPDAITTYFTIYFSSAFAQQINFLIGRLTATDSQKNVQCNATRLWLTCFTTFWHPQLAAVTCYSFGTNHSLKYRQFAWPFLTFSITWSIFWALVIYRYGGAIATPELFRWLVVAYLAIWTLRSIMNAIRLSRQ